jgi:hypothetical protein
MVALDHGLEVCPAGAKVEENLHVISATNCHLAPFDFFFTLFMPQEHQRLPMGVANSH